MTYLGGSKNVLLVENDPAWHLIISRALRALDPGAHLHVARTVGQAAEILASGEHFDLVICDIFLNGKETGLDLYKFLRAKRKSLPVMMISSLTVEEFNAQFSGASDKPAFFSKSLEVERLKFLLLQELRHSSSLDRAMNVGMLSAMLALALVLAMPTRLIDSTNFPRTRPTSVQSRSLFPGAASNSAARQPAQQKSLVDLGSQIAEKIVEEEAALKPTNVQNGEIESDK